MFQTVLFFFINPLERLLLGSIDIASITHPVKFTIPSILTILFNILDLRKNRIAIVVFSIA